VLPGCAYSGQKSVSLPGAMSTRRVHADVARQAFELLGEIEQLPDLLFLLVALRQHGLLLERVGNGDVLAWLGRNELGDAVAEGVAQVEHPPDVAHRGARGHGAEGRDLRHGSTPYFSFT
jgi:hypothetical protein